MQASEQGATLELAPESSAHLTPGSIVTYSRTKVWFPKLGVLHCHVLSLSAGSVQVQTSADEPVVVRSKRLTVAAKGGSLAAGTNAVMALRGTAWIRKSGTWRRLGERRRTAMTYNGEVELLDLVLPAPKVGAARVLAAPSGRVELGTVRWGPVMGAGSYVLTVLEKGGQRELLHRSYRAPGSEQRVVSLEPGKYTIAVAAIDAHGLPGDVASVDVTVVGVQSEGAVPGERGVVLVEAKTPVLLTHTEGLEMRLGDSPEWFPAVASINVRQGALAVHLRNPHSRSAARIDVSLKQRARAEVHVGPKTAIWPRDEVVATISLGKGNVDTGVRIESQIGTTPIDLDWKREGSVLTAVIPKPDKAGPWVVRIGVFDGDGLLLGRDNLEVACRAEALCSSPPVALSRVKGPSAERYATRR